MMAQPCTASRIVSLLGLLVALVAAHWRIPSRSRNDEFWPPFTPAKLGCSMAHCDKHMSDQGNMMVPSGEVGILWNDRGPVGSPFMLGCSSNGFVAACSFGPLGSDPFLKAYNGDGDVLWSYDGLGPLASFSAPMIDASGRVIAADASNVVMLDQNGSLLWAVPLPGLNPLSPVILDNGLVVVLTVEGSMLSIDPLTGTSFNGDRLVDTIGGKQGRFATRNTPLVSGNRIYSINEFLPNDGSADETNTGRLFAIDVRSPDQDGPPFELAWSLEFGARSGGSPTIADGVIFFDGDFEVPTPSTEAWDPHMFGVKDMGRYGIFTFKLPMEKEVRGSGTADPYGRGLWYTARGAPWRLLTASGEVIDEINVNDYPELESNAKASIGTFGWSKSGNAVALFTTGWFTGEGPLLSAGSHFYHVGIDIKTKELVYSTFMGNELINWSSCQAATVIDSRGEPVVVIVTAGTGVFGIGRKKTTREQLS